MTISVADSSSPSRRRLLATASGVDVTTNVDFARGDGAAAAALANALQTAPQTVFPVRLFGQVAVPKVQVKKVVGPGAWAGIGIGIAAGVAGG